ncbi:MAG: peptidoglycan D,D-transpeptidase FtsI family protein [Actinomycetota bacterium]
MNRQIRAVGYVALALFGLVFLNLNWIQLVRANRLANDPGNVRLLLKEYAIERGPILAADVTTTLAQSQPTPSESLKFVRTYPTGPLFAHVAGYYSIVFGRDRLERSYNKALTGSGGVLTMQDLGDRLLGRGEKGDSVVITIDSRVQKATTDAIGSNAGAVVALDPLSGDVLALVSTPSFDPNPLSGHDTTAMRNIWKQLHADAAKPLLNRATAESYPPGSTFKVVTAAAAIENGKGIDTSFPPVAEYLAPQTSRPIANFGGRSCGGDMAAALKVSCNAYFARLGAELPRGALAETAKKFGFGEIPPLDLRSAASRVPSEEELRSPAFAAQASIGQFNVSATPLQMALVAAGIANDGKVPVPRLLKEIRDARGAIVEQAKSKIWKEAVSATTAATVRDLMVQVVDAGTARAAAIPGVRVAGKTGTAQVGREGAPPHAWFIAFAPADAPRIAVAVVVENGGNLGDEATGGRVAAPIARKVIEAHRELARW